ncbi:MAG TPA: hypothetical protein VD837_15040 [Terriglobales bacterium]|nr:hypothetical protein [Terriglobales bacterium]
MTAKKKTPPKKQPKPAAKKKSREDVNQAAFRIVREATDKD